METVSSHYEQHYTTGNLSAQIAQMLANAGTSLADATNEQMAMFDQFHVRGVLATQELAAKAGFEAGLHILDVGSGIGGTTRYLNSVLGCTTTGIDLTREFVDTATAITTARRQADIKFVHGSAIDMPFEDATFDGAWMQHVNMNIADKAGLFKEIARVLKPGATLAMHEIIAGNADQPHFPVPWSRNPEGSHLAHEPEFKQALSGAGFELSEWTDETQACIDWFKAMFLKGQEGGPPPINVGVLLGPDFPEMGQNALRSMEEGRIKVVMVVAVKR